MKTSILISSLVFLNISADKCSDKKELTSSGNKYKARLETKALCLNYTFTLLQGKADTSLVNAVWTDESTGKVYSNAFGFTNPCDFPAAIKEGDEFWFVIDSANQKECAVCMAYYPTPPKKIPIRVVPE